MVLTRELPLMGCFSGGIMASGFAALRGGLRLRRCF